MARPLYPQKLYYLRRDFVLREERFARSAGFVCFLFVWKVSRDASEALCGARTAWRKFHYTYTTALFVRTVSQHVR